MEIPSNEKWEELKSDAKTQASYLMLVCGVLVFYAAALYGVFVLGRALWRAL